MDRNNLKSVFRNYINKFNFINDAEHDETFKWEVMQYFHDHFDINATDFHDMLKDVWKNTSILIDNSQLHPFNAIVTYAKDEPEAVRNMMRNLFADDGGDLSVRQNKIDHFISESEKLCEQYFHGTWPYQNDQRSAMAYLFLNDPDHHYLYKATPAHEFADCVEFYGDLGSGRSFNMSAYYKMCDELVSFMKEDAELIKTHRSRYEDKSRCLHQDAMYHILAFDLIYCSQVYNLYDGIHYSHIDTKARNLYMENVKKAQELQSAYNTAVAKDRKLNEIKEFIYPQLYIEMPVRHKVFGIGRITKIDGDNIDVVFERNALEKRFVTLSALAGKFIIVDIPGAEESVTENADIINDMFKIKDKLKRAEEALNPYLEYLDESFK